MSNVSLLEKAIPPTTVNFPETSDKSICIRRVDCFFLRSRNTLNTTNCGRAKSWKLELSQSFPRESFPKVQIFHIFDGISSYVQTSSDNDALTMLQHCLPRNHRTFVKTTFALPCNNHVASLQPSSRAIFLSAFRESKNHVWKQSPFSKLCSSFVSCHYLPLL